MKKPVFEGVATALVTPFKNGTIDLPTLQKPVSYTHLTLPTTSIV